jgi:putative Mn2+ efflux pump MntP
MDILTIMLTAIGLAMDCLAVSMSCGISLDNFDRRDALKLGVFFGGFQAMMAFLGWLGGTGFSGRIQSVDHWIAFVLLIIIGAKMIHEAFGEDDESKNMDIRNLRILIVLSIATSIDALAIGISYAFLHMSIILPVILIGLVSFIFAFAGSTFGKNMGERFGKRMEIVGGIILIGLGIKILVEHTML